MKRTILAILVGYIASAAIFLVGIYLRDWMLHDADYDPGAVDGLLMAAVMLGVIIGGFIAASVADHHESRHALFLGILLVAAYAPVFALTDGPLPTWFEIAYVAAALPAAWIGGAVRAKRSVT